MKLKCLDSFELKIIAIISMLIDHIGAVFFPNLLFLRIIGRIAFPIYCFMIVNGYFHTSNKKKYALRLFVFAIISEIPFDLAFSKKLLNGNMQNVFFTLFVGLMTVWIVDIIRKYIITETFVLEKVLEAITVILGCAIALFFHTDYSLYGILMIYWFYIFRNSKPLLLLFQAYTNIGLMGYVQCFGTLGLIPIFMYNDKKGRKINKYFFYSFYPAHLILLFALKMLLKTI